MRRMQRTGLTSSLAADQGVRNAVRLRGQRKARGLTLFEVLIVVSLIGITRPGFPGSAAAARLTMLLSVIFVAGALSTAVITST